jgi:hypothetical protein
MAPGPQAAESRLSAELFRERVVFLPQSIAVPEGARAPPISITRTDYGASVRAAAFGGPYNRYSALIAICRRQTKGIQHMSWYDEAHKSCREHCCKDHNHDDLLHVLFRKALKPTVRELQTCSAQRSHEVSRFLLHHPTTWQSPTGSCGIR